MCIITISTDTHASGSVIAYGRRSVRRMTNTAAVPAPQIGASTRSAPR